LHYVPTRAARHRWIRSARWTSGTAPSRSMVEVLRARTFVSACG